MLTYDEAVKRGGAYRDRVRRGVLDMQMQEPQPIFGLIEGFMQPALPVRKANGNARKLNARGKRAASRVSGFTNRRFSTIRLPEARFARWAVFSLFAYSSVYGTSLAFPETTESAFVFIARLIVPQSVSDRISAGFDCAKRLPVWEDGDGQQIHLRQAKTGSPVCAVLTPGAQEAVRHWIQHSGKLPHHALFTRQKANDASPISLDRYRSLIKDWVQSIGLDSTDYSSHSLRRTKPVFLYGKGVAIEDIALLLGHQDTRSTLRYLGLTLAHAHAEALRYDLF
jgi:hypothetical protein